jgi:hypothetical protein
LRERRAKLSGKSGTAKAIDYSLMRWLAFTRFLDDGRLCMSNNAAECELRAAAVGRKNWTFAGSNEGGRRAAAIYTLIQTAKLNALDPQAWLADVLARPTIPPSVSASCCRGTGGARTRTLRPPEPQFLICPWPSPEAYAQLVQGSSSRAKRFSMSTHSRRRLHPA